MSTIAIGITEGSRFTLVRAGVVGGNLGAKKHEGQHGGDQLNGHEQPERGGEAEAARTPGIAVSTWRIFSAQTSHTMEGIEKSTSEIGPAGASRAIIILN
jgi:hypothetical protein